MGRRCCLFFFFFFFFLTLAPCLAITWQLDLQIECFKFLCNLDFWENKFHEESIAKLC